MIDNFYSCLENEASRDTLIYNTEKNIKKDTQLK